MKKKSSDFQRLATVALGLLMSSSCVVPSNNLSATSSSAEHVGQTLYEQKCSACHELIPPKSYSFPAWKEKIVEFGPLADLQPEEEKKILAYLRSKS